MTDPNPDLDPAEEALPAWAERLNAHRDEIIPLALAPKRPATPATPFAPTPLPPKSGILVVNKPAGQTSHDVVQAVRRASGVRRVGHAGTLDPMATGVLVVCLESATRVIEEIQDGAKTYLARVRLGEATNTYDREGDVVNVADPSGVTQAEVEAALAGFRGPILQVPPMFSALKHAGRPLYELARQGIELERPPRPVTVHSLELVGWSPPEFEVRLCVSKGTYVRSIAHDLGQALGVGAHLVALEREAVGRFTLASAERLARVVEAFVEGWWPKLLYPLDTALLDYTAMVVDAATEVALRQGQQMDGLPATPDTTRLVRVYNDAGYFVGLVRWDAISGRWQPERIFPAIKPVTGTAT